MNDIQPLLHKIASQYTLDPHGVHGVKHWARVLENGLRIAETEGGDTLVITLFAIFHDACRRNQARDPGHGARGAALAEKLLASYPLVNDSQLTLLVKACREHTDGETLADPTIQICWDADRLDLARVGILPHPTRLCTPAAKSDLLINWANDRALENFAPVFIQEKWGPIFPGY